MREKLIVAVSLFFIVSIYAVFITFKDKKAAIHSKFRVSEKKLIIISIIGGSFAMYATMKFIHHKTNKRKFMIGLPLIMLTQLSIFLYFMLVNI